MKTKHARRLIQAATASLALALPAILNATAYQWDVNGTDIGLGGSGSWDTTSAFWDLFPDGIDDGTDPTTAYTFTSADTAIFGGDADTVTLSTGVTLNSLIFNTTGYAITGDTLTLDGGTPAVTTNADATISSILAGSVQWSKAGTGLLSLTNGSNSFSGGLSLNAGTLSFANGSLGTTGAITMNGGTLQWATGNTQNISSRLTMVNATTATFDTNGNNVSFATAIGSSSSASLAKTGAGTLTLANSSTFTGKTSVTGGVLAIAADSALGTAPGSPVADQLTLNGGTLQVTAAGQTLNVNRGITLGASGGTLSTPAAISNTYTLTVAGKITGTGPLTLDSNAGTSNNGLGINLTNTGNDFTGDVTITKGMVTYANNSVFGNVANKIILNGGGLIDNNTNIALSRNIQVLAGGGTFRTYGSSNVTWSGNITGSGNVSRIDGGTLALSGDLSGYGGTFTHSAGTTNLTGTASSIGGNWVLSANGLNVNSTANQTLAGNISGASQFTKLGTGTLTITGNNIYTGGTNANGGVLEASSVADAGGIGGIGTAYLGIANDGTFRYTGTGAESTGRALWIDTGTGTKTIDVSSATGDLTFSSTVGNINKNFQKTGAGKLTIADSMSVGTTVTVNGGTLALTGVSVYTGTTLINGGTLALTSATGAITSATATTIASGGTLKIDNSTASIADRFGTGTITLTGGTLDYAHGGTAATNYAETLGTVVINGTGSTLSTSQAATGAGETSILTLGSIGYASGSLNFSGTGLGVDDRNKIVITGMGDGYLMPWATVNGSGMASYSSTLGVTTAGAFTDVPFGGTISDGPGTNIRLSGGDPLDGDVLLGSATTTVNNILQAQTTATTIDTASQTLRLGAAGGISLTSGVASLTIGTAPESGTLTAGGAPATAGTVNLTNGDAISLLTVNSVIADNGATVGVATGGPGKVVLAGTNTYTGTTTLYAATTEFSGGTQTLAGAFSGTGALLKTNSAATLTLSGANSHSGGTTVNAGTLNARVTNGQNALGTGAVSVGASGTLIINDINTTTDTTVSNIFSGGGNIRLDFANAGSARNTRLNGTNALAGFTGTLRLSLASGATTTGSKLADITSIGGSLIIDSGTQFYASAATSVAGGITVSGTGNTETRGAIRLGNTLTSNLTLAGDTTIGTEGGTIAGTITSGAAGTQTLTLGSTNSTGNSTLSGAIGGGTGTIALTKTQAGTATLSGANTYTGATLVSGGRLNLSNTNTSAITINSGAIFGTLAAGSTTGTLTLDSGANVALAGGATLGGFTANGLTVGGNLAVGFDTAAVVNNTYTIANYGGGGFTGALTNMVVTSGHGQFSDTGSAVTVKYLGGPTTSTWNTGAGTWDLYSNNWTTALGDTKYASGDAVVFNTPAANSTVTTSGTVTPGSVTVNNTANTWTLAGNIGGSGSVAKYGAGTLTFTGTKSTSGDVAVYGGQFNLSSGNQQNIGSGRLYVFGGATASNTTTHVFGVGTSTNVKLLGGTFNANGNEFYLANIDMAGGTITQSATGEFRFSGNRTITVLPSATSSTINRRMNANATGTRTSTFQINDGPAATDLVFSQNISSGGDGTTDAIIKSGLGLMKFTTSTAHGYVGATVIGGGTLELDYATSSLASGMINAASDLKLGGGNLVLTGKSTASAVTQTLDVATLNAGGSGITLTGATGGVSLTTGTLTRNTGATLGISTTGTTTLTFGGTAPTLTNDILPYATINGNDFATHTLGVVSAYAGYVADDYTAAANNVNVTTVNPTPAAFTVNSLAFRTAQTNNLTLAGANTAGAILVGSGVGAFNTTITGTAANTLQGTSGGELIVHQNNTGGTLSITAAIVNNGTATALVKSGAGTLILGGTNTYSGTTYLNGGITRFTTQANIGNSTGAITFGGGTLQWATGSTVNIATGRTVTIGSGGGTFDTNGNNVSVGAFGAGSSGTFTKTGAGILTMGTAQPNFSGSVVVNGGEMAVTNGTGLGANANQSIQVNTGGILTLSTNTLSDGHNTAVLRNIYVNGGTVRNASGAALRMGNIWLNGGTLTTQNGTDANFTTFYLGTQQNNTAGANSTVFVEGSTASTINTTGTTNNGIQLGPNVHFQVADVTGNANTDLTVSVRMQDQSQAQSFAAAGITKLGAGTMSLTGTGGNHTFTGGTTVNGGTLSLDGGGNGTAGVIRGTVTVNSGGTLRLNAVDVTGYGTGTDRVSTINLTGGTMHVNVTANQTLGGTAINLTGGAITGVANSNLDFFAGGSAINSLASATTSTIAGAKINLRQNNGLTVTVADGSAADDLNISSVISNSGGFTNNNLTKAGAGHLVFSGTAANTYTTDTIVSAGKLTLDKNDGVTAVAGNITVNGTGILTTSANKSGRIADTSNVTVDGASAQFQFGDNQNDTINTLAVNNGGTVNIGATGSNLRPNGGITSSGGGTITMTAGGSGLNFNGATRTVAVSNNTLAISAPISNGGLTKSGAGALTLSVTNSYSGATTVNAGTLTLGHATDTISSSSAIVVDGASAVLAIGGNSDTVGAVSLKNGGSITGTTGVLTGASYAVESGSASAILGGSGINLTKDTAGTVTLNGANTYTGTTTIKAGTLALGASGSIDNSTTIVVGDTGSSGTVLDATAKSGLTIGSSQTLKGIGTVDVGTGNTLTIEGTHAAGNSVGTQSVTGDLTYAGGAIFEWDINASLDADAAGMDDGTAGTDFDNVNVTGNLVADGTSGTGSIFRVVFGSTAKADIEGGAGTAFWNTAGITQIWNMTSLFGKNFTSGQFASVETYDTSGAYDVSAKGSFTINGTSLTWTAVPEPSSALAGLLVGAGLLRRRRRDA